VQEGGRAPVDAHSGGRLRARHGGPALGGRAKPGVVLAATATAAVVADQVTKALAASLLASGPPARIVRGVLDLELTRNPGGAFGILPQSPLLFFLATVVIVAAVLVWGLRTGQAPVALGLIAGGGLGNLIDRVARAPGGLQGRVVDFIHVPFWPTFNVADSAIVVGVGLLVILELRPRRL